MQGSFGETEKDMEYEKQSQTCKQANLELYQKPWN